MSERPLRIAVSGCCGRMGSLIIEEAFEEPRLFAVVGGLEQEGHPKLGATLRGRVRATITSDVKSLLAQADLLIEFTTPEASLAHAQAAAGMKIPMVIGTTGFSAEQFEKLRTLSKKIPIFWSPNMSIGIVIVRRAIGEISELLLRFGLGEKTKVKISEIHHTKKKDKPSGTAKALAQELLKATGWLIRDEEIEAKREGETIGIHSVTFHSPSERITLTHEATDRRLFAQGALLVARHFSKIGKKPDWYGMDDFVKFMQEAKAL